jgi:hypothetical protein
MVHLESICCVQSGGWGGLNVPAHLREEWVAEVPPIPVTILVSPTGRER